MGKLLVDEIGDIDWRLVERGMGLEESHSSDLRA